MKGNMMKIILSVSILLVLIVSIAIGILLREHKEEDSIYNKEKVKNMSEQKQTDTIIIKNENIENEKLIDEFIEKVGTTTQKITLNIHEYASETEFEEKQLTYVPGTYNYAKKEGDTTNIYAGEPKLESYKQVYGYYIYQVGNDEQNTEIFDNFHWKIKRNTKDGKVNVILDTNSLDVTEYPVLFTYNLSSANYHQEFQIDFTFYNDKRVKEIIPKNTLVGYDFGIYSFSGDVTILKDGKEYDFKQALENKIITVEDILEQGKLDAKYGICNEAHYKDGGSIEYQYINYTILKYYTLDGNGDFIIGSTGASGQIINEISKILND